MGQLHFQTIISKISTTTPTLWKYFPKESQCNFILQQKLTSHFYLSSTLFRHVKCHHILLKNHFRILHPFAISSDLRRSGVREMNTIKMAGIIKIIAMENERRRREISSKKTMLIVAEGKKVSACETDNDSRRTIDRRRKSELFSEKSRR